MKYKGTVVTFDNFRKKFSSYSVDIQDIIRSALLDMVDILPYIDACKDDPFRLDQIRLSIKEGTVTGTEEGSGSELFSLSGTNIYKVRQLLIKNKAIKISDITCHLGGALTDTHVGYLLGWVQEGYNLVGIDISLIPLAQLPLYDAGWKKGIDMGKLSVGIYSDKYLSALVRIMSSHRSIYEKFLDSSKWSESVVNLVALHSGASWQWFFDWVGYITPDMSYERVSGLLDYFSAKGAYGKEKKGLSESSLAKMPNEVLAKVVKYISEVADLSVFDECTTEGEVYEVYLKNKTAPSTKIAGTFARKHR